MKHIFDILSEFSDYELSVFYTYKIKQYLPQTQTSIQDYVFNQRGLDQDKIHDYIGKMSLLTVKDSLVRCPRCKTSKLQKDSIEGNKTDFNKISKEEPITILPFLEIKTDQYKDTNRLSCVVCGQIIFDRTLEEEKTDKNFLYYFKRLPVIGPFFRLINYFANAFKTN